MKKLYCVVHQQEHTSVDGWRHAKWETPSGEVEGWACHKVSYPEFVPDRIKTQRKKHKTDMLQPFREGNFSREFKEAYPERTKSMVKDGVISNNEVRKAKEVWKDI